MKNFLFLGGDLRMLYAARHLNKRYDCFVYGFDKGEITPPVAVLREPAKYSAVILPLPASLDGQHISAPYSSENIDLAFIGQVLEDGGTVFTSKDFPYLDQICEKHGYLQENYFGREELQLMNAVPTAEGALEIMMRELPVTIFGLSVLITGFGRIGKVLARQLTALGARVTVAARSCEQLAQAQIAGCETVKLGAELDGVLSVTDVILNTVPAPIFDRRRLMLLRKECLIIDLASKKSVEDMELAQSAGVNVVWALSLPGKTAPVTAGEIIGKTIENMLTERRDKNA